MSPLIENKRMSCALQFDFSPVPGGLVFHNLRLPLRHLLPVRRDQEKNGIETRPHPTTGVAPAGLIRQRQKHPTKAGARSAQWPTCRTNGTQQRANARDAKRTFAQGTDRITTARKAVDLLQHQNRGQSEAAHTTVPGGTCTSSSRS